MMQLSIVVHGYKCNSCRLAGLVFTMANHSKVASEVFKLNVLKIGGSQIQAALGTRTQFMEHILILP